MVKALKTLLKANVPIDECAEHASRSEHAFRTKVAGDLVRAILDNKALRTSIVDTVCMSAGYDREVSESLVQCLGEMFPSGMLTTSLF